MTQASGHYGRRPTPNFVTISKFRESMIKLSVVASDIIGVSGRAIMAALVAGERDPKVLADLARGSMRGKTARLEEAFTGRFTDHHAFPLRPCCQGRRHRRRRR